MTTERKPIFFHFGPNCQLCYIIFTDDIYAFELIKNLVKLSTPLSEILIDQKNNSSKLEIYFLKSTLKHIINNICSILNLKEGNF